MLRAADCADCSALSAPSGLPGSGPWAGCPSEPRPRGLATRLSLNRRHGADDADAANFEFQSPRPTHTLAFNNNKYNVCLVYTHILTPCRIEGCTRSE
eukprot:scaffold30041_cov107-Isochrysis_galbana.AAC.1